LDRGRLGGRKGKGPGGSEKGNGPPTDSKKKDQIKIQRTNQKKEANAREKKTKKWGRYPWMG